MRHLLERLEQMAIDITPIAAVVEKLGASITALTELATAKMAETESAAAATAAQVAADEASAVDALNQVSTHLTALATQIDTFVAAHTTPAATPAA